MMARHTRPDERQTDLFGWTPPLPAPRARRRAVQPSPESASPPPEPDTAVSFAARATPFDLDEFVTALDDEGLAHLALASARQLRRRLGRTNGGQSRAKDAKARRTPLDRAGAQLAADWALPSEETW